MADARQVVRQSRQVGFGSTGQHQRMRDAVDIEVDALIVRHFDRVIDQGFITVGAIKPVTARIGSDGGQRGGDVPARGRSEEHTSELQSLMRISYAVFCLKKKRQLQITQQSNTHHTKYTNMY